MTIKVLSCKILQKELEMLAEELDFELQFIDAGQNVNPDILAGAVNNKLNQLEEHRVILIFGNFCFTAMETTTRPFNTTMPGVNNCIEMVADPDTIAAICDEAQSFFMTPGWLENWKAIFKRA